MPTTNDISAHNTLRIIALSTSDTLAHTIALDVLGESEDQARHELSQTCWVEDMDNLREAVETNFQTKGQ